MYSLRQLFNLKNHITAKALAGLLVSSKNITTLFIGSPDLLTGKDLLQNLKYSTVPVLVDLHDEKKYWDVSLKLSDQLRYDDHIIKALDDQIITKKLELVKFQGLGKKSFHVSYPPLQLNQKGFGILGKEVNHHAFHSVVGLLQLLGQKHTADNDYLEKLLKVSKYCGLSYIFNNISYNQEELAINILTLSGISLSTTIKR